MGCSTGRRGVRLLDFHLVLRFAVLSVTRLLLSPSPRLLQQARADAGSVSEATSYWQASRALDWFGLDDDRDPLARRAFTEEHARDSLENALFGIARFAELTGKAPRNLTVVGYEFKRERFEKAHRTAVRWPEERFTYLGTPAANAEREVESAASEVTPPVVIFFFSPPSPFFS